LSATAVSIGLLVAELVINALKHAFPDGRDDCQVTVGFEVNGSDWKLVVSDNGIGKPIISAVAAGSGLGSSLIKALAHQLDAKIDIASSPRGRSVSVTHATFASRLAGEQQVENLMQIVSPSFWHLRYSSERNLNAKEPPLIWVKDVATPLGTISTKR
jgi:anti-sigma regulatory factor (Ser/Thr protein kinase)